MIPLAERMRPQSLDEWVGHEHLLTEGRPLYDAIMADKLFSFVLYAPPGVGKSTLCFLIRKYSKNRFVSLSAVTSGVKDLKAAIDEAKLWKERQQRETVLFIDEIHRFNKSQQDALLPGVERGEIVLMGATTENPSFELNAALLSRVRVFRMEALRKEDIQKILTRAVKTFFKDSPSISTEVIQLISSLSQGDARVALNALELVRSNPIPERVQEIFESKILFHDKSGDLHYQVISAFIKSMRAGQTDAALYYLARLWSAGEDPLFIARRMVIFASEDVGNADLKALALTNAVRHAVEFIGRPECYYALAQGVLYLSKAPKSREVGEQFSKALETVEKTGSLAVPNFLINPQSPLDRELGRGRKRNSNESYLPGELMNPPSTI